MSRKKTRSKVRSRKDTARSTTNRKQQRSSQTRDKKTGGANAHQRKNKQTSTQQQDENEPTVLLLFNKPFQVMCQFTDQDDRETLANYIKQPGLYPAGRLDRDSEGLLLLTNNGMLQHRISHPNFKLPKTYLVQVEGEVSRKAIDQLRKGVKLNDGPTAPAEVEQVEEPDWLWERNPPIRSRKDIPTSWIQIQLIEGRNRQVRRMTAEVGYPTLRLIRTRIGSHSVLKLAPGEFSEATDTFL